MVGAALAGVMLLELQSYSGQQQELASEEDDVVDRGSLMATLDVLKLRYSRGTVSIVSAGLAGDRYQATNFAFDTGFLNFSVRHVIADQDGSFAILQKVIPANSCSASLQESASSLEREYRP